MIKLRILRETDNPGLSSKWALNAITGNPYKREATGV